MSGLHYYYYCPETNAYELDESPIPAKSPSQSENHTPTYPNNPYSSNPYTPFFDDDDSFFGSSSEESDSSLAYQQNAIISANPKIEPVQDNWTGDRGRGLDVESKSSPFYNRIEHSEIYSDYRPQARHARSTGKLTKPPPVRLERQNRLLNLLPSSSRGANSPQFTAPRHSQALTLVSSCPAHGRHLNGACTCPPGFQNPYGHPRPRSSFSVLQIDTRNSLYGTRPGSRIPPSVNGPGSRLSFPLTSLSRPRLKLELRKSTVDSGTTFNRRYSDGSERRSTSCYQARVSGSGPQKLTKRRPVQSRPISAPSVPSSLSPLPLTSSDIAAAKLSLVSIPPLTLDEYLSSSKRRHRLSLRELADIEEMADMLHSARPASSPLKQNSPHQQRKTRHTNFLSSVSTPSMSYSDPNHHRIPTNTDALSSLAWTGLVPSISPSPIKIGRSEESLYSCEYDVQPGSMNSNKPRQGTELQRGWTFAMAMADEEVTDEVLVEQLEHIRNSASSLGSGKDHQFHPSFAWIQHPSGHGQSISSPNVNDTSLHPHTLSRAHTLDVDDATTWPTARKALLCCREMVRTEKRYQEELKTLINGKTTTPPPVLMLTYLPALLRASQTLLKGLSEDPSAWGVSTAFMGCEPELEAAMVAWSGVAGQFFSKKKSRSWKRRSGSQTHLSAPSSPSSMHFPPMPSIKSDGMTTTAALPPKLVLMGDKEKKGCGVDERAEKTCDKADADDEKKASRAERTERKLTVRDLAIQPTQRVMRYVMLYRDLLAHTPQSSPSRPLVECALEAAQRIAQKCDLAQDHAAFLRASPSDSSLVPSPSESLSKHTLRTFMSVVPTRQEN